MARPNILYIHSHDTGRYIQPYGYAVATPRLQRLAEQGVCFRQAFCAAPTCSPSRAALLTGQAPHSCGMIGLAHRGFRLREPSEHLVHTLGAAGYVSALAGVQHVAKDATRIGYDQILKTPGNRAAQVAPATVEFLNEAPDRPFFLSVGFSETHREFPEPRGDGDKGSEDGRYCLPPAPLPDTPRTRRDMAAFAASARDLDTGVSAVLEALEANGLSEKTLVIATTDHGIAFPGMKCNLTDHGIGVMLIVRGPGGFEGGLVCDGMVSQIDIFPTLCEILEIAPPAWLQGKSILPVVRGLTGKVGIAGGDGGRAIEVNDEIFAEVTYHAAYEPMRAVRTKRYKYIRRYDDRHGPVLPNCDDGPSKDVLIEHGWRNRTPASEQLYDLVFDKNESGNLADDLAMVGVLEEMRGRLDRWMRATSDPLIEGAARAPSGAVMNDPDGLSPHDMTHVVL